MIVNKKRDRAWRLGRANAFIHVVSSASRGLFTYGGRVSALEFDERGRLWWVEAWRGRRTYTHDRRNGWPKFHNGGTLKALVEDLCDWVLHGKQFRFTSRHWGITADASALLAGVAVSFGIMPRGLDS